MAHNDKKFEKGMTPAQKKKFEDKDEKNDSKLAEDIKGKGKKKAPAKKPKKK